MAPSTARPKPTLRLRRLLPHTASMALLFLGCTMLPAPNASAVEVGELVVNGTFSNWDAGWRTNDPSNHPLKVTYTGRWNTRAAEISPKDSNTVTLNDATNTVVGGAAKVTYKMSAFVKSSKADVTAQLRAREEHSSGSTSHSTRVVLSNSQWRQVDFQFTTVRAGSDLDLNVQFWGTSPGQKVYVDDVSLLRVNGPAGSENPSEPQVPPPTGQCTRPAPTGVKFGSSISTVGQDAATAVANTDALFGKIPVVRIWDPVMPFDWQNARTKILNGRTLVMSFRPSPKDVLSGKHDAELRRWFQEAPSTSTIYWNYYHEPETPIDNEKRFTADEYRRAWRHIDAIADSVCRPNMYATLVLMGWTTRPESKKNWRDYYPGSDAIDVMAFDPYNGAANPGREGIYASPESIFDTVRKAAAEAGKPYAIAETGTLLLPGDKGSGRAGWLRSITAYHRKHGALWVTYFNSTNGGEYRLLDTPSRDAWREAVASSR